MVVCEQRDELQDKLAFANETLDDTLVSRSFKPWGVVVCV